MMPLSVRRCECSVHIACVKTKIPLARAISCLLYRICNNATNPVLRNRVIMFIRVLRLRIYPPPTSRGMVCCFSHWAILLLD